MADQETGRTYRLRCDLWGWGMASITHICVSDLHLGATNSVLTNLTPDGEYATGGTSPMMRQLVEVLAVLAEASSGDAPRLIIAGDLFELALSDVNTAADTFTALMNAIFERRKPPVGPIIDFVPGNHDHHLWEAAREAQYFGYLAGLTENDTLEPPWHVTSMMSASLKLPHLDNFVTGLARRAVATSGVEVRHTYPNLGLFDQDRDRCVVFHHGHYVESMYRLMELVHQVITPGRDPAIEAAHIEADNFAWVDFFWSTMARAGDAGRGIGAMYEMLQSEAAVKDVTDRLVDALLARRPGFIAVRQVERFVLRRLVHRAVDRMLAHERHRSPSELSVDAERGLRDYLSTAVRQQLVSEVGHVPKDTTFVFGHTHKPFVRTVASMAYPQLVPVYNTGGWVVDGAEPEAIKGASIVVVDDARNVAAIELYRQRATPGEYEVVVRAATTNPLADWLGELVDPGRDPWRSLSEAAAEAVAQRNRAFTARVQWDVDYVRGLGVIPVAPGGSAPPASSPSARMLGAKK